MEVSDDKRAAAALNVFVTFRFFLQKRKNRVRVRAPAGRHPPPPNDLPAPTTAYSSSTTAPFGSSRNRSRTSPRGAPRPEQLTLRLARVPGRETKKKMEFRGHAESEVDSLMRLSSPVRSTTLARWQRKALEQQDAGVAAPSPAARRTTAKTPRKTPQVRAARAPTRSLPDAADAHLWRSAARCAVPVAG